MAAPNSRAPTVSVPMASRPYYLTHRRSIESAIADAVKSIMDTEPLDPIAGLALHFARRSSTMQPEPTPTDWSSGEPDLVARCLLVALEAQVDGDCDPSSLRGIATQLGELQNKAQRLSVEREGMPSGKAPLGGQQLEPPAGGMDPPTHAVQHA